PKPSTERIACDAIVEELVEFAAGKGIKYAVLNDGDELQLVFGSQAGMEARVTVQTVGVALSEVTYSEVRLDVDDFPIAQMAIWGEDCSCDEGVTKMAAPMLVDVVPHPTVNSVLQLSGRSAQFVVMIYGEKGLLAEATT